MDSQVGTMGANAGPPRPAFGNDIEVACRADLGAGRRRMLERKTGRCAGLSLVQHIEGLTRAPRLAVGRPGITSALRLRTALSSRPIRQQIGRASCRERV